MPWYTVSVRKMIFFKHFLSADTKTFHSVFVLICVYDRFFEKVKVVNIYTRINELRAYFQWSYCASWVKFFLICLGGMGWESDHHKYHVV